MVLNPTISIFHRTTSLALKCAKTVSSAVFETHTSEAVAFTHVSQHCGGVSDEKVFKWHDRSVRPLDIDVPSLTQLVRFIIRGVHNETWILGSRNTTKHHNPLRRLYVSKYWTTRHKMH